MDNIDDILKHFDDAGFDYDKIMDEFGLDIKQLENDFKNYSPKKSISYKKINEDTPEPKYNYDGDSGFDLYSTEDIVIPALGRALIPTGLVFDIPDGYEIQVRSKSGLAINLGLFVLNSPGTVDSGYIGEIKVILFNTNNSEYKILKGAKVAQAVISPVLSGKWVNLQKVDNINDKNRGSNGFGSTGI